MEKIVTVTLTYGKPYTPPRKRIPRTEVVTEDVEFKIPVLSVEEAPMAFYYEENDIAWYSYDGELWETTDRYKVEDQKVDSWPTWQTDDPSETKYHDRFGREKGLKSLEWLNDIIIVDGKTCVRSNEPGYRAGTLNWGKHWYTQVTTSDPHYNALEIDLLREKAERTEDKGGTANYGGLTVLLPDLVKRRYSYEIDYENLVEEVEGYLSEINNKLWFPRHDCCGINSNGSINPKATPFCVNHDCLFGSDRKTCLVTKLSDLDYSGLLRFSIWKTIDYEFNGRIKGIIEKGGLDQSDVRKIDRKKAIAAIVDSIFNNSSIVECIDLGFEYTIDSLLNEKA